MAAKQLCGFQKSKSVDRGKGSGKSVQGQGQGRRAGKTSIASQALPPVEPPMRALRTGENPWSRLAQWFGQAGGLSGDVHAFGTDHAQPVTSDLRAGPIAPQDRGDGKPSGWMRKRGWWAGQRSWSRSLRENHRPEDGTDPPGFAAGRAFLTLRTQLAGTAIAEASGIQDAQGAIALWSAFLRVERVMSGAE